MICKGETKKSGTAIPFISTVTPPSVVGKGSDDADVVDAARPVPNMDPIPPPEILAENPAPSVTPAAGTIGGAGAVTVRLTLTVCCGGDASGFAIVMLPW